jgi:gliding motility-associated-like protein
MAAENQNILSCNHYMRTVRSSAIFNIAAFFFGIILSTPVQAQICTGSLGDAVINVTFGSGPGTGSALPGATTFYNFVSYDCPNDGSYTVINATAACFGNSWHSLSQDHTPGDNDGRMMLVNASIDPGDFFVDTARGLCANTTYEFSAWVVNVLLTSACSGNGNDPKLVFNIETTAGVVLGTYSTGDIPETASPEWKQYGLFFTTPINTNDVVIRITNNAPGGCGNDIALDDISFRPCGPTVNATIANSTETAIDLCAANIATASLSATIGSGYVGPSQQWQESLDNGVTWADIPGATTKDYLFTKTAIGIYQYRLTVAEGTNIVLSKCRVASNVVTVTIHDKPIVSASSNSPVCESTSLQLNTNTGTVFSWTGPAGFTATLQSPSFTAEANAAGQYDVVVTDEFGCVNTASTTAVIIPKPTAVVSAGQSVCEGGSVALSASGGDTFLWSPAEGLSGITVTNPTATPAQTTVYIVSVTNSTTCTDTASVTITVWEKPSASAGEDKVILKGEPVQLNGTVGGSEISYSWLPVNFLNDPTLAQPNTLVPHDTTYTLTVVSTVGCGTATDDVFVKVFNDIYIPTAFSPNNDSRNDTWRIEALVAFPKAVVSVYNRYGNKLFEGSGSSSFWDGTFKGELQPPGTYVYMIDFKSERPLRKGWVMLVR